MDEAVRHFLHIPLHLDFPKLSPRMAAKYHSVGNTWSYGRRINLECGHFERPDKKGPQKNCHYGEHQEGNLDPA